MPKKTNLHTNLLNKLLLYGFHDPLLLNNYNLLIPSSIVISRAEYGHFISRIASEFINNNSLIHREMLLN
jgi:hypothetical protein